MSYINSLVDKVFVINLDKDKQRLEKIDASLRKQGISYERIPGILGSTVKDDDRLTGFCNIFCTDGIKGCALSHHTAWEQMIQNGYSRILVFEDDAIIPPDFDEKVRDVMARLPQDYEVVFLGCRFFCSNKSVTQKVGHVVMGTTPEPFEENISRVTGSLGAHAVLYTSDFVKKIIGQPINTHIDIQLQHWIKHFNSKAYGVNPEIVDTSPNVNTSNIGDSFPPLANKFLGNFEFTEKVPLNWALSENLWKLGPFNINAYLVIMIVFAVFLPFWIIPLLFVWLAAEVFVSQDIQNGLRYSIFLVIASVINIALQNFKVFMFPFKSKQK